ncbi:hypothetical protein [Microbacterium sp.]|jgi:hypothetical protein|uniref:hypothetical protein n=1 Tax=Microbacterium sp. TaxID=51671 RepID=UPI002C2D1365|nr:hypothetical protein [Microbacterium sp.]HWL78277.1 hypothetical protein [Microbacterium sp.]
MNDTLARVRPPDTDALLSTSLSDVSRLSPLDRLELRLGLWLLLHSGRRNGAARDTEARALLLEQNRARTDREHDALRKHALLSVRS